MESESKFLVRLYKGENFQFSVGMSDDSMDIHTTSRSCTGKLQNGSVQWRGEKSEDQSPLETLFHHESIIVPSYLATALEKIWRDWKRSKELEADAADALARERLEQLSTWILAVNDSSPDWLS